MKGLFFSRKLENTSSTQLGYPDLSNGSTEVYWLNWKAVKVEVSRRQGCWCHNGDEIEPIHLGIAR